MLAALRMAARMHQNMQLETQKLKNMGRGHCKREDCDTPYVTPFLLNIKPGASQLYLGQGDLQLSSTGTDYHRCWQCCIAFMHCITYYEFMMTILMLQCLHVRYVRWSRVDWNGDLWFVASALRAVTSSEMLWRHDIQHTRICDVSNSC